MTKNKAIIYLVITSILWSTGGLFIKLVDWNPLAIAGARSGIAAILMILYLRRPIKTLDRVKVMGGLAYAAMVIMFVTANKLTTAANTIFLQFTAPVWVLLFSSWFLKEKSRKSDWVTVAVVMMGMGLFFIGDLDQGNTLGNIIAVFSGVAFAALIILLKLYKGGSPVEITLLGNIFTFIIGIPFYFLSVPSSSSILGLLILGVFQLGLSYILFTMVIKHVSAVEAILIPIIEPLLNPVWVLIITGESPGIYALWGGIIVIAAIISRELYQHKKVGYTGTV